MAYGAILGKSTVTQSQLNNASPYNWLDNSDFTNLVMQAGLNGKHGTTTYMADRWIVTGGTPTYTAGTGVRFNGLIQQKLEFAPTGDVTVIVKTTSGYITSKDSPENINTQVSYYTGTTNYVTIDSNGTDTIQWVALYEGNYKDTTKIPTYHPKGYANELATCQRYYYQVSGLGARAAMGLFNNSTLFLFPFFVPVSMRVSPTIVSQNTGVYRMGANIIPGKDITILRRMPNNGYILQMTINTPLPSPLGKTETGLLSSSKNSATLLLSFVADL